ncbi:unnamed protein product [Adineta ricciae]|uniref:Uncharacterized protein n=1 Tax=Adineta ricciae TaxID=249248 RepID=A0A815E2G9_ADIRI|nr:unnamed protein product [Adineta ricciae]CAF1431150.1 unnamed protein product [Adineta ricciae]
MMMKISYAILAVLIIGIVECSNETAIAPSGRIASRCYYCANCPQPFYPNGPGVTQVSTPSGWCTMMSSTGPPSSVAVYTTRGSAVSGLCTYTGCSWKIYAGVNTYVCCCNQNLCNAASITPTTPRPTSNTCYFCSTCPLPFTKNSALVTYTTSPNGWCTKMSSSASPNSIATRGADPGVCSYSGCYWTTYQGRSTYICCCRGYLCNTGVSTKKSTVALLGAALVMMFAARKNL